MLPGSSLNLQKTDHPAMNERPVRGGSNVRIDGSGTVLDNKPYTTLLALPGVDLDRWHRSPRCYRRPALQTARQRANQPCRYS